MTKNGHFLPAVKSLEDLETEVQAVALSSGETREEVVARVLEAQPEIDKQYRKAITGLCRLAGYPERAGDFIASRMGVYQVSELLSAEQVDRADRLRVSGRHDPAGRGGLSMEDLEAQAVEFARQAPGGLTKEQAFTRMLESNPEVYAAYRLQHNALAGMGL